MIPAVGGRRLRVAVLSQTCLMNRGVYVTSQGQQRLLIAFDERRPQQVEGVERHP